MVVPLKYLVTMPRSNTNDIDF